MRVQVRWYKGYNQAHYAGTFVSILQAQGRLDDAQPLYREALDSKPEKLGGKHPDHVVSFNSHATC